MKDSDLRHDAMYQVEASIDLIAMNTCADGSIAQDHVKELDARLSAATYMLQAMFNGYRPENYKAIVDEALEYDAVLETNAAIKFAKRP